MTVPGLYATGLKLVGNTGTVPSDSWLYLTFACWGLVLAFAGEPALLLECLYCGVECKVDLTPYKRRVTTVGRGEEAGSDAIRCEFPDRVPTSEPGNETPTRGILVPSFLSFPRAAWENEKPERFRISRDGIDGHSPPYGLWSSSGWIEHGERASFIHRLHRLFLSSSAGIGVICELNMEGPLTRSPKLLKFEIILTHKNCAPGD